MISAFVADDHPLVREHVAEAISSDSRLELVGEAGDGTEALRKVEEQRPDTIVLDVGLPVLDGAAVLRSLRERHLPTRVLLLAGHASVVQMRNVLRYRPDSLLLMDANVSGICEELVAIDTGGDLSPGRLHLERAQLLARNRVELSGREWDVLRLSAEGLTRARIGERLRFGPSTVRDVRRDICTKLDAPTMQVAIVKAMRTGLLE
ncbi:MAG: two-component system, NarL family, nitrate/nitrite response regulator NarL [Solirubrobacterales bacterium]|nr:two-component system, NarL family, nitrate/nitrite response regulator NarL [Solirubrobacterales bacterium]HWC09211.1 response regulator transcription factor [Solirubrobacterales bacterium]